ncbi:MAG: hypothetical protein WKF73_00340 [Nocardioidaceae bacterium]
MQLAPRLTDYWVTVFRRVWKGSVVTSFLTPFLYLAAMGVGLGSFIDDNAGPAALGGITYLAFVGPGLLATSAMQTAIFESTYPVMGAFKWHRSYFSMAATPLTPSDIVAGQLAFIGFRIFATCGVFLAVLALFGALGSWWGGLARARRLRPHWAGARDADGRSHVTHAQRVRLRTGLPAWADADVPLQRGVLPDHASCPRRSPGWLISPRSGTAST